MENAVEIKDLGKMYRLYDKKSDRIQDLFGINKFRFWDQKPRYKEFWALRNVDLIVPKGERVGIIGRNGAGKSTLLKLITGNLKPTEGSVKVNGEIQAMLQMGTGFHPEFTGIENIRTALAYAGMDRNKINSYIDEIIDFSELEDYIQQPVKYYSAGMYSRLAFAVSTALEPDILIIDEVLGAGDAAFTSKCADRMKRLTHETGATVLFVSHSMDSVLEICDRAILLERGMITHQGTALEVSKIYNKKIREEEELRARAKEYRVSKKNLKAIAQADESTSVIVFRIVCDQEHPEYTHNFYDLEIKHQDETVSSLHIGAPMDDDLSQFTRIIADRGLTDWSNAKKDRASYYRAYSNQNGRNGHAPFQMAVPIYMAADELAIQIKAKPDSREKIYVEYFDGHEYHRLGEVKNGLTEYAFRLSEKTNEEVSNDVGDPADAIQNENIVSAETDLKADKEKPETVEDCGVEENKMKAVSVEMEDRIGQSQENAEKEEIEESATDMKMLRETNSVYGSQELSIEKMEILNGEGKSARVFVTGETLQFEIILRAKQVVESFVAVVCIMSRSGRVVSQMFCRSEDLGISRLENTTACIYAKLSPLRIGQGEYMVSIGLYKQCNMEVLAEEASYCVADRVLFFKVQQPFMIRKMMGDLLHTCEWSLNDRSYEFDAAKWSKEG